MISTEDVLAQHTKAFDDGDLSAILDDYTDDSVVITQMGVFRGREEIEGLFEELLAEFSNPDFTFSVDEGIVDADYACVVWHAETPVNEYEFATDTFVVENSAIVAQTFAGKITPK